MRRVGAVVLGLALAVTGLACEIDGSIGRAGSAGTAAGAGSGTEGASGQATDSADGTAEAGSAASVGGGTGGGTGGEGGTADGPTDQPAVCHPTPDDQACARCRKASCCAAYEACLAHDSCLCWWECVATDTPEGQCSELCDTDGLLYQELQICVQMHCDSCPM